METKKLADKKVIKNSDKNKAIAKVVATAQKTAKVKKKKIDNSIVKNKTKIEKKKEKQAKKLKNNKAIVKHKIKLVDNIEKNQKINLNKKKIENTKNQNLKNVKNVKKESKIESKNLKIAKQKSKAENKNLKITNKEGKNLKATKQDNSKVAVKSKKRKKAKFIVISILIFALILGGGIGYLFWDINRQFEVSFADVGGVTFEGFSNSTVQNRTEVSFSITADSGIVTYPQLLSVTANGVPISQENGTYTFIVRGDTTILASGYGSENLTIVGTKLTTGVNSSNVVIPYGITTISAGAFNSKTSITQVNIPDSVTEIGSNAFSDCSNLENITFSDNLLEIDNLAFSGTKWLSNQPDGVIYIDKILYLYKGTMPASYSYTVTAGTISISSFAFFGQTNLIGINIADSVQYIGSSAFYQCSSLSSINIGENVKRIDGYAFMSTAWYNSQSNGLVYLGNWLYSYIQSSSNPTSLIIRDGTVGIAGTAFLQNSNLISISIPDSVKYICEMAFAACYNLTAIELPSNLEFIGEVAFAQTGITSISIPSSVNKIETMAFMSCNSLVSINILCDLDILEMYTFSGSVIASVVIEGDIETITSTVFLQCPNLVSLTLYSTTPPVISGIGFLESTSSSLAIYVPANSVETYKSSAGWSAFSDKIFAITE